MRFRSKIFLSIALLFFILLLGTKDTFAIVEGVKVYKPFHLLNYPNESLKLSERDSSGFSDYNEKLVKVNKGFKNESIRKAFFDVKKDFENNLFDKISMDNNAVNQNIKGYLNRSKSSISDYEQKILSSNIRTLNEVDGFQGNENSHNLICARYIFKKIFPNFKFNINSENLSSKGRNLVERIDEFHNSMSLEYDFNCYLAFMNNAKANGKKTVLDAYNIYDSINTLVKNSAEIKDGYQANRKHKTIQHNTSNPKPYEMIDFDKESTLNTDKVIVEDDILPSVEAEMIARNNSNVETEKEKQYRECSRSAFIFGWLICPALLDMSESFLGKLYEWIYLRFAKVESGLFRSYQDNPVFKAWEVVKDLSNVVFIIMFMLVIISQISGFGISNYGIKKSLPKIIAAAILINMSFFISQLFVDTSNIIGSSIVNFMNNLGGEVSGKVSINAGATTALSTVLIGVIGFAVLNPASLITLALMLIPVATALLLAFALLMIRQVAVVMLVIMSPLIVALYILPNTRSVVEKYKRLAFSMWLFYPATAFIIGASGLTARIFVLISNADGTDNQFVYTVIALAVLVMPFFMIPKLLTKTMDGIGGIGAKLSGARLKASRGAVTKLNNTRAMKRARNAMNSWGGDSRFGRMRNFLTGGAVAKAISDQEKLRKEANMEKVTMDSGARRERAMMDKIQFDEAMNKDLREERIINADLKHLQNIDKDAIKDRTEQSIMGHKVSMAEIAARNNYTDYYDNMTASKVNSAQSKIKQQMVETTIEAINAGNHTVSGGSYIDAGGNKISGDVKISNPRDVGQLTNALQSAVSSGNSISVQAISSYMAKNGMEKDLISTYESLSSGGGMDLEIQDSSIADMVSMRESMMQGMAAGGISDPILKKLSKQHNSGQNEVSIQTASISAAADLTAEKLSVMDVESIQAIEKSLMEATKNLAVDPATGIYNTSGLDSKTREAIKTMGNISSQFNPANPNSSHLRGKTKQENMDAIEKMFNTHSKLADIYSSL